MLARTSICMLNFAVFFTARAPLTVLIGKNFCGKKNRQNGKNEIYIYIFFLILFYHLTGD